MCLISLAFSKSCNQGTYRMAKTVSTIWPNTSGVEDMPLCFECNKESEHQHHVVPRALGGTKTVDLCSECHGKAHGEQGFRRTAELARIGYDRWKTGKQTRRGGNAPYGFQVSATGKLEPNAAEEEIIQYARKLRANGASARFIAKQLNDRGWFSRSGKPFSISAVYNICAAVDKYSALVESTAS